MRCEITLPPTWIDSAALETAIRAAGGPHGKDIFEIEITIPTGCRIMIVAAIRLLSLCNQLVLSSRRVKLNFKDADASGYLNRVGFFDHLAPMVQVLSGRPSISTAAIYRGGNSGVVEIARINKDSRDNSLPTRRRRMSAAFPSLAALPLASRRISPHRRYVYHRYVYHASAT